MTGSYLCRSSLTDVEITESSESFINATARALSAASGRLQPAACYTHTHTRVLLSVGHELYTIYKLHLHSLSSIVCM